MFGVLLNYYKKEMGCWLRFRAEEVDRVEAGVDVAVQDHIVCQLAGKIMNFMTAFEQTLI